jgi:hypothetical protein
LLSRAPDVVVLTPSLPIRLQIYRCSKTFETDYVKTLFDDHDVNLLILLNGDTCKVFEQKHTACTEIKEFTTHRTSSTRRGGQSAARFARNREIELNRFVSDCTDYLNHLVLYEKKYNNIYLGGFGAPFERIRFDFDVTEKIILDTLSVFKMMEKITVVKTVDVTIIKTILDTEPDKLAYGVIDMSDIVDIKMLFVTSDFKETNRVLLDEYKSTAPKLIINVSDDPLIVDFGGMIGLKH